MPPGSEIITILYKKCCSFDPLTDLIVFQLMFFDRGKLGMFVLNNVAVVMFFETFTVNLYK